MGSFRRVKHHTFNGVKYYVDVQEPHHGICSNPNEKKQKPFLIVNDDIKTKEGLSTLLHECLHALKWSKSEDEVDGASKDIASLLWRLGFRIR